MADPQLVANITARLDAFEREMKRAGRVAERELEAVERMAQRMGTAVGSAIGNVAADAVRFLARELVNIPQEFVQIAKAARELQIPADIIDGIGQVMQKTGGDASKARGELEKFALAVAAGAQDSESLVAQLARIGGVSLTANGQLKSTTELLALMARVITSMRDPVQRLQALQAVGLSPDMLPVLERVAKEGLAPLAREARATAQEIEQLAKDWQTLVNIAKSVPVEVFRLFRDMAQSFRGGAAGAAKLSTEIERIEGRINALKGGQLELQRALDELNKRPQTFADRWKQATDNTAAADAEYLRNKIKQNDALIAQEERLLQAATESAAGPAKDVRLSQFQQNARAVETSVQALKREQFTMTATAGAAQQLRTEVQLLEAAQKAGVVASQAQITEYVRLRTEGLDPATAAQKALTDTSGEYSRVIANQVVPELQRLGTTALDTANKQEQMRQLTSAARDFSSALSSGFSDLIVQGKKFDEVLRTMIQRLSSRAIDRLFEMILLGPSGTGGGGLLGGLIRRQHGGPVSAGRPYMVGESGPELFVPRSPGRIVANPGGASVSIVSNVDARGSQMGEGQFRMILAESNRQLERRILDAVPARMAYQRANGT
jgi:hypothetical protein